MTQLTLSNQATTSAATQTLTSDRDRAEALIAQCPDCGDAFRLTMQMVHELRDREGNPKLTIEDLARSILKTDERLKEWNLDIRNRINGMPWLCEQCADTRDTQANAQMNEYRIRRLRQNCYASTMPADAAEWTFTANDAHLERGNEEVWLSARTIPPLKSNVWIYGPPDTGKTRLARCLLNASIDKGRTVGELSAIQLNATAARWEWDKEIERYATVHTLLLDDLDKPSWTTKGVEALWWLVDRRCNSKRPTIVTANAGGQAVKKAIGERTGNPTMAASIIRRLMPVDRMELFEPTITALRKQR